MEEIDVREERCVQITVPIGGKQRRPIDGCVTAIARFSDCKVWISRDDATPAKNTHRLWVSCGLTNLFIVRPRLLRA